MMKVVLAGGAGNVGREIYDALVAQKDYEVVIFSRKEMPELTAQGVSIVQVDYNDKTSLIQHLQGVHTVLSFIVTMADPHNIAQKTLIDACIEAKVRRFAPSEWATRSHCGILSYAGKDEVSDYLNLINQEKSVLEYTLFQPGLFLNYFSYPHASTKHMHIFQMPIDIAQCRAIMQKDTRAQISLTTVQDLAQVVVEAIRWEEKWPKVSGMRGTQISILDFVALCSKIRGRQFAIEEVEETDLQAEKITASWLPLIDHPAIPQEQRTAFSQSYFANFILAFEKGAWDASDEWNQRLPDMKFTGAEEFLRKVWEGKP